MKSWIGSLIVVAVTATAGPALAADQSPVPVTIDNFNRAETHKYFAATVQAGAFGRLVHRAELVQVDRQNVVRPNRDTLYSTGVFDLDAGPVTITMPETHGRFMSMQVIDEDHYVVAVDYGAGSRTFSRGRVGGRYILVALRTFVDPANPTDLEQARALQAAVQVRQARTGAFTLPAWDAASQAKVRSVLLELGRTVPDTRKMFGARGMVDPVRHLVGTALAWGGNPEKDAIYLNVTPERNDGQTLYRMTVRDAPVDGFWSVSVYNAQGYFVANPQNAYTINNVTAKKAADGAVTIRFGGCDIQVTNCLPTMPGWNYMVRLYRPRSTILQHTWTFPAATQIP